MAGGEAPGHIKAVVKDILPVVEEGKKLVGDAVHNCVVLNARRVAEAVRKDVPGTVKVVAADYELETGKVRVLETPGAPK